MTGLAEDDLPHTTAAILRATVPVWAALTALLVLTLVLAYVPMGRWGVVVAVGVAAVKAVLIGLFFMNLRRPDPLLRLAGGGAILWIAFLFALTFADVLTRPPLTQPGTIAPRGSVVPDAPGGQLF